MPVRKEYCWLKRRNTLSERGGFCPNAGPKNRDSTSLPRCNLRVSCSVVWIVVLALIARASRSYLVNTRYFDNLDIRGWLRRPAAADPHLPTPNCGLWTILKNVEARMRSPLRIRAPNKVIDFSIGDQAQSVRNGLNTACIYLALCKCRWRLPHHR
jgi:hypothetical protein